MKSLLLVVFLVHLSLITAVKGQTIYDVGPIDWNTVAPIYKLPSFFETNPYFDKFLIEEPSDDHLSNFVTGGTDATPGQFPYTVGLVMHLPDGSGFCSGTLVSQNFILTAAHCLDGIPSGIAVLGSNNIRDSNEVGQRRVFIDQFILHPNWNSSQLHDDIGLIRLPITVPISTTIRPVRLPNIRQLQSTFFNQQGTVAGWGTTADWNQEISSIQQYAKSQVMSNLNCLISYPLFIESSHICTSTAQGRSPCRGDSGAALTILEADNLETQIGLFSFVSFFGCEAGRPAAYSRITYYLFWIAENSDVVIRPGFDK